MPQVGSIGQRKLLDSKVLMVGAGGIGSPILIYLAAQGVGNIGIIDYDKVDKIRGIDITIVTITDKDKEAKSLLKSFNVSNK